MLKTKAAKVTLYFTCDKKYKNYLANNSEIILKQINRNRFKWVKIVMNQQSAIVQ